MSRSKKLLLIIEDAFYRELILNKYRNAQQWVIEAVSNAGSLPDFNRYIPDAVVVDDKLATTTADAVLSVLQLNVPSSRTVVLTSDPGSSRRSELIRNGAYDAVTKDEYTLELLERMLSRIETSAAVEKGYMIAGQPVSGSAASSALLQNEERTLEEYTMDIIRDFLSRYDNNVVLVARKLGVGKSTIYRYLKEKKLTLSGTPRAGESVIPATAEHQVSDIRPSAGGAVAAFSGLTATRTENQLVDLDYLLNVYNGDRKAVAGMIDVFLQTMDRHVTLLKKHQSEQNLSGVLHCLQEMKPVVEYMGMHSLKSNVVQAKLMIDTHMEWGVINNSLSEVYSLYARCTEELRQQHRRLL